LERIISAATALIQFHAQDWRFSSASFWFDGEEKNDVVLSGIGWEGDLWSGFSGVEDPRRTEWDDVVLSGIGWE